MATHPHDQPSLDKFLLQDKTAVNQKIQRFAQAGVDRLLFLFDFDRTLTTTTHLKKDITFWRLLDDLLPPASRESYDQQCNNFQQLENAGKMTEADALAWWGLSFDSYVRHGVNLHEVCKTLGQLQVRKGAVELFHLCESQDIPRIILSAGIGNAIEIITEDHGMRPTTILATRLEASTDGRITGWDPDGVVHALNKQEKGRHILSAVHQQRPYIVLLGDSVKDAQMVEGVDNVLRIRVAENFADVADQNAFAQESFDAGFDLIVQGDLHPVVDLTHWLLRSGRQVKK